MTRGLEDVVEYLFDEDHINLRAILKKNNMFEIDNEIAQYDVSFFNDHFHDIRLFKKLYIYLIDFLHLSSFLDIFHSFLTLDDGSD